MIIIQYNSKSAQTSCGKAVASSDPSNCFINNTWHLTTSNSHQNLHNIVKCTIYSIVSRQH